MGISRDDCRISDWPVRDPSAGKYTIMRASAKNDHLLTVMSPKPLWIMTHYWCGRTGPCLKDYCPACERNCLPREHGYFFAFNHLLKRRVIVEITTEPAEALLQALKDYTHLVGVNIILGRHTKKINGKVRIEIRGVQTDRADIKCDDDLWTVLSRIWGLDKRSSPTDRGTDDANVITDQTAQAMLLPPSIGDEDQWVDALRKPASNQRVLALPTSEGTFVLPTIEKSKNGTH